MTKLGQYNRLQILKALDFGIYLDGDTLGEILMPKRYIPTDAMPGDYIEAFVYMDSEDRPIATTEKPYAQVGECAYLKVTAVNAMGAFLDWGLTKDLLVPFREQAQKMELNERYVVYVYIDEETQRIVASAKLNKYIHKKDPYFEPNDEVDILVASRTDLGYKAIVNDEFWGILYKNQVFKDLAIGQKMKAYIHQVREDGKLDLLLQKAGYEAIEDVSKQLYETLQKRGGYLPLNDKSPAEFIYDELGLSKKSFKKAIGDLYKKHLIVMEEDGIRVV